MRIGRLEIRLAKEPEATSIDVASIPVDGVDRSGSLAVPDTTPWWVAVHQIINEAERETVRGARNKTRYTNDCIAAVGAGEGVCLVRDKLISKRAAALDVAKARGELR